MLNSAKKGKQKKLMLKMSFFIILIYWIYKLQKKKNSFLISLISAPDSVFNIFHKIIIVSPLEEMVIIGSKWGLWACLGVTLQTLRVSLGFNR
jgi:hypothetical protein